MANRSKVSANKVASSAIEDAELAQIAQTEAWHIMLAMKSGMLSEASWAVDSLNMLLHDDSTASYFNLKNMPGFLDTLTDYFSHYLQPMFGLKVTSKHRKGKTKLHKCKSKQHIKMETSEQTDSKTASMKMINDENDHTWVTRKGKPVIVDPKTLNTPIMIGTCSWQTSADNGDCALKLGSETLPSHLYNLECNVDPQMTSFLENLHQDEHKRHKYFGSNDEAVVGKSSIKRRRKYRETDCNCLRKNWPYQDVADPKQIALKHIDEEDEDEEDDEDERDTSNDNRVKTATVNGHCNGGSSTTTNTTSTALVGAKRRKQGSRCTTPTPGCAVPGSSASTYSLGPSTSSANSTSTNNGPSTSHSTDTSRMNGGDGVVKVNGILTSTPIKKEEREEDAHSEAECNSSDETSDEDDPPDANTSLDSVEAPFIAMDADMFHDSLPCCRTGLCSNSPRKKFKEEAIVNDSSPFRLLGEGKFEQARRCLCISNVFRSLSFVPGNDAIMSCNDMLIGILSRILLLEHRHEIRTENRPFERDETDTIQPMDTNEKNDQWWFLTLKLIRENALVVMANICNKLILFHRTETITLPLLDGLIHWAICPSSEAVDPLANSVLSLQRLALEALCKLCMSRENVDLLIATPPYCRLATFISTLVTFLSDKDQVLKEFAVVIFSYLVQGDAVVARTIGLYEQSVSLLVDFVETAEQKASQIASEQGVHKFLENPEKMGTSLDMLRRAANTLVCISRVAETRQIFLRNEERLLALVMSQILDQQVAQTLSEVLYRCTSEAKREEI